MCIRLSQEEKNNRISIFRVIVSLPRPGGGFGDVRHVGTCQFSVSGANVPPQFIARWNGSISVESHSNCMQMGRHMLKQAKTKRNVEWQAVRQDIYLSLYGKCVSVYKYVC